MEHRPPGPEGGAPLHELTDNGVYPDDVYDQPSWYTTSSEERKAYSLAARVRGDPKARVWMYRAVPCDAPHVINEGDWVTTVKDYAVQHGRHPTDPSKDMCVLMARTKAKCLHTDGNSLAEWGYNCTTRWSPRVVSRPRRKRRR
jgi:hypothetical protein